MHSKTHPTVARALFAIFSALTIASAQTPSGVSSPTPMPDDDQEVITLPEYTVSAQFRPDDYVATEATSGTRVGSKILELPFNIQVLTRQFIEDFQFFQADQQLAFVPNYSPRDTDLGVVTGNRLRGFQPVVLRDGFLRAAPGNFSNTGQVEVLMGPQSVQYGQTSPGGVVNYISKRPRTKAGYKLSTIWGNYDFQRHEFEATGPLYKNKLFYLFTASYNYNRSDLDYYFQQLYLYNFTVTYKLSEKTSITAYWEQQKSLQNKGDGLPGILIGSTVSGGNPLTRGGGVVTSSYLPLAHFNQYGPDDRATRDFDGTSVLIEHRFNRSWSGRVAVQKYWKDFAERRWTGGLNYVPETGRLTSSTPFVQLQTDRATSVQADLSGRFETGSVKHALLLAGDYTRQTFEDDQYQLTTAAINALPPTRRFLDPANPDWSYRVDWDNVNRATSISQRNFLIGGALFSHRMYFLNNRLITMLSGRYMSVHSKVTNPLKPNDAPADIVRDEGTYSAGLSYRLLGDQLLVYSSYSKSVDEAVPSVDLGTGDIRQAEKGHGPEVGFKGLLWDSRVNYTVAFFETVKDNISTTNPEFISVGSTPGVPQFLTQGQNRVRGVDVSASSRLTKALLVGGTFGYLDTEVTKSPDNAALLGDVLLYTPRLTGSGMIKYSFLSGRLKGLRIGASGTYTGGTVISSGTKTRLREQHPPVQLYNAFLSYDWRVGRLQHSININTLNLFDKFYLNGSDRIGRGREIRVSYKLSF